MTWILYGGSFAAVLTYLLVWSRMTTWFVVLVLRKVLVPLNQALRVPAAGKPANALAIRTEPGGELRLHSKDAAGVALVMPVPHSLFDADQLGLCHWRSMYHESPHLTCTKAPVRFDALNHPVHACRTPECPLPHTMQVSASAISTSIRSNWAWAVVQWTSQSCHWPVSMCSGPLGPAHVPCALLVSRLRYSNGKHPR